MEQPGWCCSVHYIAARLVSGRVIHDTSWYRGVITLRVTMGVVCVYYIRVTGTRGMIMPNPFRRGFGWAV